MRKNIHKAKHVMTKLVEFSATAKPWRRRQLNFLRRAGGPAGIGLSQPESGRRRG
jgi:hypothetical protein